jgi:hypothetical protein
MESYPVRDKTRQEYVGWGPLAGYHYSDRLEETLPKKPGPCRAKTKRRRPPTHSIDTA